MSFFIQNFPTIFTLLYYIVWFVFVGLVLFITSRSLQLSRPTLGRALGAAIISLLVSSIFVAGIAFLIGRFYVGGVSSVVSTPLSFIIAVSVIRWVYKTSWRTAVFAGAVTIGIGLLGWHTGWYLVDILWIDN